MPASNTDSSNAAERVNDDASGFVRAVGRGARYCFGMRGRPNKETT
jgi:hypothetical protein